MDDLPNLPYVDKMDQWSSHGIIAGWVRKLPEKSVILDIGTASGTIGRLCSGLGFIRKGIEPNDAWAELACPYYEDFSNHTVQETNDEFIRGADVVLFADILEHLPDPEVTLRRVVDLQSPRCQIIISVPNTANIWVRINLLFGRFEYTDRGILDRTHLRFFTRASFGKLLDDSGLDIHLCRVSAIPVYIVHPFFKDTSIGRFLYHVFGKVTQVFPTLLGYQFVALTTRKINNE